MPYFVPDKVAGIMMRRQICLINISCILKNTAQRGL